MIAARWSVASSTVWPPERKTMPVSSAGTWLKRISAVLAPTSDEVEGVGNCLPARIMLHFRMQALRLTLKSASFWNN